MTDTHSRVRLPHATDVYSADDIARFKASGMWQDAVLTDFLTRHANERPDDIAIVAEEGSITWGELAASVDRLAAGLLDLGLRRGDIVGVQLPNRIEFVQTYLAIQRAGLHALTMLMIYREHDVRYMLGKCGARAFVVPDSYRGFDHAGMAKALAAEDGSCGAHVGGL